jgi:predicted RNA polymerase sigma factor
VRTDLCAEAIRLGRLVRALMSPPPGESTALLALMLLHDSRREARLDEAGEMVLLEDQDRRRWNHAQITEALLKEPLATRLNALLGQTAQARFAALVETPLRLL